MELQLQASDFKGNRYADGQDCAIGRALRRTMGLKKQQYRVGGVTVTANNKKYQIGKVKVNGKKITDFFTERDFSHLRNLAHLNCFPREATIELKETVEL